MRRHRDAHAKGQSRFGKIKTAAPGRRDFYSQPTVSLQQSDTVLEKGKTAPKGKIRSTAGIHTTHTRKHQLCENTPAFRKSSSQTNSQIWAFAYASRAQTALHDSFRFTGCATPKLIAIKIEAHLRAKKHGFCGTETRLWGIPSSVPDRPQKLRK